MGKVICFDAFPDHEWIKTIPNASYEELDTVLRSSDFITIHVPLLPQTHHMINEEAFAKMKQDVVLVNTSRGETVSVRTRHPVITHRLLYRPGSGADHCQDTLQ